VVSQLQVCIDTIQCQRLTVFVGVFVKNFTKEGITHLTFLSEVMIRLFFRLEMGQGGEVVPDIGFQGNQFILKRIDFLFPKLD